MSRYADRIWLQVPAGAIPDRFASRSAFMLGHVRPGETVLDLGCGTGVFSQALIAAGAACVAVDVSAFALQRASEAVPGLDVRPCDDGEPLPLVDGEVDGCWAGDVLEHVQDVVGLLDEVARAVRPGGWLAVATPLVGRGALLRAACSARGPQSLLDVRSDHVRFFDPAALRELLEEAGFEGVALAAPGRPGHRWIHASARRQGA